MGLQISQESHQTICQLPAEKRDRRMNELKIVVGSKNLELLVVTVVLPGRVVQLLVVLARGVVGDPVHVALVAIHMSHVGGPL